MEITKSQGDIAGRMRKWEPVRFGPEIRDAYNYAAWENLEKSAPKFHKVSKEVVADVLKKASEQISKGKLNIKV